ncbi:MAG: single-stranded DNA-binding protein [Clostridia bacterium]|nr:single-stranded DNA-binding protein [Clostridia bacterium]
MAFNKVILVGNLVADPELKQTPSGVSVATFTLAVQRRYAKPDDAQQADFINIVAWRQTAEFISRYFSKGKSILVCGAIQSRSYTDQNGQKRYVTEVVAEEATFVEKKSSDSPRGNDMFYGEPPRQSFGGNAPTAPADSNFEEVGEDDLPF